MNDDYNDADNDADAGDDDNGLAVWRTAPLPWSAPHPGAAIGLMYLEPIVDEITHRARDRIQDRLSTPLAARTWAPDPDQALDALSTEIGALITLRLANAWIDNMIATADAAHRRGTALADHLIDHLTDRLAGLLTDDDLDSADADALDRLRQAIRGTADPADDDADHWGYVGVDLAIALEDRLARAHLAGLVADALTDDATGSE